MTASSAPFGVRPVVHGRGGTVRSVGVPSGIASGTVSSIYTGDPVFLQASGRLVVAAAASAMYGIFAGVDYTDATGYVHRGAYWPGGTTATNVTAYVWRDPDIIFEVQADGSIPLTALGDTADLVRTGSGSAPSGQANAPLSSALAGAGNTSNFKIVGFNTQPNNAPGDTYTIVQVIMNDTAGFTPGAGV